MISFASIWAIFLRYIRLWKKDLNLQLSGFYWPLLDILIMGFLGKWISEFQAAQFQNYQTVMLLGILLWIVVGRGCNFLAFSFIEELWSNNLVNLFSLPLHIFEWICANILFYIFMISITCAFCMFIIFMSYNVSLWQIISVFMIFGPPLIFSAIWLGFTCMQIIATFGKRGVELGWVIGWFFLPFSGAYYPIEVLPHWAQKMSNFLPMAHIFQGMRAYVMHHQDPTPYLIKGYALGFLYALLSIILFIYCFNRSKRKGLARLSD